MLGTSSHTHTHYYYLFCYGFFVLFTAKKRYKKVNKVISCVLLWHLSIYLFTHSPWKSNLRKCVSTKKAATHTHHVTTPPQNLRKILPFAVFDCEVKDMHMLRRLL
ncbi:hypothetical protein Dimus_002094 [Dionaea muscipula]